MIKALFVALQLAVSSFACLYAKPLLAQVTSDGTINTQVNQNGNVAEITGGETRGNNLFHSFQDFSVPNSNEAFFNNANEISNIFSRVTGGNISNIDGAISANGSASLFLINPAGIIFGENASLNLGGSFYGSTSSSILFEDGEFSAVDNLEQPLLTVNAPIGLGFRDNPGEIINRSLVQDNTEEIVGLEVNQGNTLALIGGELNFAGGQTTAQGGDIYLGGLAEAGIVNLNQDGSLTFPQDLALADVTLTNAANVDVRGTGGGNITVDAQNLTLEAEESGNSFIGSGIISESTNPNAQAGTITINVAENIRLSNSFIINQVDSEGIGNSGNITINTASLELTNGSGVDASTRGQGNAGTINITATDNIIADGENSDGFPSGIISGVDTNAEGNSGGIIIATSNLNLTNGGRIIADTFSQGNAGVIDIIATGDITIDGENSNGSSSSINSQVNSDAVGDAGGVTISTSNLNLTNGGDVGASTLGQGNAGAVDITATGDITADGENLNNVQSGITSLVTPNAEGSSEGITISTSNLNLTNGAQVIADTFGQGNAGKVSVIATGDITVDGENSEGFQSGITSQVSSDAVGDSGGVTISTSNLNLTNGGRVNASTGGQGDAGAINITATGDIIASGEDLDGSSSSINSQVNSDAIGDAGGITISTSNLNLTNGGDVGASTLGQGNAGAVNITATGDITANGQDSRGFSSGITSGVDTNAVGDAGEIKISTSNLNLNNGGRVGASTGGQGNAGAISITATEDITIDGENSNDFDFSSNITSLVASDAVGDSGGITISSNNFNLTNGGLLSTLTLGQGNAGGITISTNNFNLTNGGLLSTSTSGQGNAGGITISTNNFNLFNGGRVDASTFGQGNASDINITASESISIDGLTELARSGISANAFNENGNGGNVSINTNSLTIANGGTIETTNFDNFGNENLPGTGQPGSIKIIANSLDLTDSARIEATTQFTDGVSGIINLRVAEDITLETNSFISAQAFNNADGGNLTIEARYLIGFPSQGTGNDLIATSEEGAGGNIELNVEQLFGFEQRNAVDQANDLLLNNTNDLDISGIVDGNITINALDFNPLEGSAELPSNPIDAQQTTQQACQANRETVAQNSFTISGKGGVPPEPGLSLNSLNTYIDGESDSASTIPLPVETAQGKIQPARGIKVTKSGAITLTAYHTNDAGERIPQGSRNCGQA